MTQHSDRARVTRLDSILYERPPGRDIIDYAMETIHALRARVERAEDWRDHLREALREIARQPEGDEESAQSVARQALEAK